MLKKNYKPRIFVVLSFFFVLYIVIFARLFLVQVYRQNFFQNLAKQQYEVELKISPLRARIYDKNKEPLALNKDTTSVFILPKQFTETRNTEKFLNRYFRNIYRKIKLDKNKKFAWLERGLTESRLEWFKNFDLKDIHFVSEPQRFYPFSSTSTIVGFTDIDNIGIAGTELEFDRRLAGYPTTVKVEQDARSGHFYFEKEILQEGEKGETVSLTIDSKLQYLVYDELKKTVDNFQAKSGSVLIMEPDTGKILVMANYPDFDPNQKDIKFIENSKNKIVTDLYELGSVVKAFTALAALEEEVVTPDELFDCEGKFAYIDKFRVENWKPLGILSFSDVIRYSSNVGTAKVAKRLGPKLYTQLLRLGFGSKTNIRFPGERAGFVNPPNNWSRPSVMVMSFGYEIMASLLQLGKAFCIIANGGYDFDPILVTNPPRNRNTAHQKIYKTEAIEQTKDILQTIGKNYAQGLQGYRVMGKTGTARAVKDGKYSRKYHIYSFGGIIEKDDYKRVVVTFIQEPKGAGLWASQVTAPLFNNVAQKMIIYDLMHPALSQT